MYICNIDTLQSIMHKSHLQNKSELLEASTSLLQDNYFYPAVAHATYYSCYQLMKHIWLYSMKKSEDELRSNTSQSRYGSHEYLLNEVVKYIGNLQNKLSANDIRNLRNNLLQLKRLRTDADYSDSNFDIKKSQNSIELSERVLPILKRY